MLSQIYLLEWVSHPEKALLDIQNGPWSTQLLIVRSSAEAEDQDGASNAGLFESVLNVSFENLSQAIDSVISSYGSAFSSEEHIFVQPMLQDSHMSSVRDNIWGF